MFTVWISGGGGAAASLFFVLFICFLGIYLCECLLTTKCYVLLHVHNSWFVFLLVCITFVNDYYL